MKVFARLSALRPGVKVLLAVFLLLAIAVALFDWNWFRRPLERHFMEESGREVRVEDLHVSLGLALEPTVRLRGVYIQNAPWASSKPMAVAGEVIFIFSLRSLWDRRPIVTRLVLKDADVVLERDKDGLRNWRLRHPDRRGSSRWRILTLEPHRSQVRFVHGGIDLDVVAAATPVEGAAVPAGKNRTSGGEPLSNRISFKGSYQGTAFNGVALTGEFLSFRNSGESFPVRGHVVSGKTRLDIDGSLADMLRISAMDAKVRVAGPSLSTLHPFVAFRPPASRPFDAEGLVRYADAEYAVTQLRGKIGGTTVTGETHYAPRRDEERPLIRATLRSEDANLVDLAPLAAIPDPRAPPAAQPAPGPVVGKQEGKAKRGRAGKAPVRAPAADLPVRVDRLKAIDAHVTLNAAKLRTPDVPALESLRLTVKLDNGMLNLDPLDAGMAGGRVAGSASFDARQETPSAAVTLAGNGLLLEKLVPALPENARIAARMRARVKLSGQGKSFGALLGSASGSVAAMVESGSLSNLADAKLALNRAKILGLLIRGDRDIAINCGAIAFDFHNGRGKSQAILLDTEQTRIAGAGTADLRGRSIDLLLTPEPRKPAIFSLQKSIRLLWPSQDSAVSLVDRVPMAEMKAAPQSITALLRSASNNGEPGGGCAQAFAAAASTDNGRASSGAR